MAATLESLREQHERLTMQAEIAALSRLVESESLAARVVESEWGDLVNRREYLYDTPGWGRGGYDFHITSPDDRKRGKCSPFFENEQDLALIRGVGRYLAGSTEVGIGALESIVNYTIGSGFTYEAEPLDEEESESQLIGAVQLAIDEIMEVNGWEGCQEAESFKRYARDGEAILWVQDEGGQPIVRTVEPDYLVEPENTSRLEDYLGTGGYDWSFGVATLPGRHDRPYAYFVQWEGSTTDWDVAPASEVIHIKANVDRGVKRGISDYYGPWKTIERATKLLGNTLQGSAIQATIAYIREHADGTTKSAVESFRVSKADGSYTVPRSGGGTKQVYQETFRPGRVIDTVGTKYHAGPLGMPSHSLYIEVMQAAYRIVGARWGMPEYMISGDASNANYASTLVSGSPFVRATERRQAFLKSAYSRLLWIALGLLVRHGRFRQYGVATLTELKRRVQLKIEAPAVAIENKVDEELVRKIRAEAKVLSSRTWAGQVGLDYDVEKANVLREPKADPGGCECGQSGGQGDDDGGGFGLDRGGMNRSAGGGAGRPDLRRSMLESIGPNCGTGDGGFQSGNTCAADKGGGTGGGWRNKSRKMVTHRDIESLWDDAASTKQPQTMYHEFGAISEDARSKIGIAIGEEVPDDVVASIDGQSMRHIIAGHGIETRSGQLPIEKSDAAHFGNVVQSPDSATVHTKIGDDGKEHPTLDSDGNQVVQIAKRINGKILVALAVRKGRKNLAIISAYKYPTAPLKESRQRQSPRRTSQHAPGLNRLPDAPDADDCIYSPLRDRQSQQSAIAVALESVRTTDEAQAILESLRKNS